MRGRTARSHHSVIQTERDWSSRTSQAALQSCEYVSGPCVVVREGRKEGRKGEEEHRACFTFRLRHTVQVLNGDQLHSSYLSSALPNHFSPFPARYRLMSYKRLKRVGRKSLLCIAALPR